MQPLDRITYWWHGVLVHTFDNDDLFWRVHPPEHPEWQ
jgi:hypothetical protein